MLPTTVLLRLLPFVTYLSAIATVTRAAGPAVRSGNKCAEWQTYETQFEQNSNCYNGHDSCCDVYDKMYRFIGDYGDECNIENRGYYLDFFNKYCIGTSDPMPPVHTGGGCVPCSCNACSDCENGCHKPPPTTTTCNTCGCPGHNPCYTPPSPSPMHCNTCGCPGYNPCYTPPSPSPVHCNTCGCPGYHSCNQQPPPCQQTRPPCYTVPPCGLSTCPTVPCHQNAGSPCNAVPSPSPSPVPMPCDAAGCQCVDSRCSCTGLPCTMPGSGNSGGDSGNSNNGISPISTGGECLHGSSQVNLLGGESKRVSELRVGDVVETGLHTYSRIFMFTHEDAVSMAQFVQLRTSANTTVAVTHGHFIYTRRGGLKRAAEVGQQDEILRVVSSDGARQWVQVTDVQRAVWKQGVFNPQTMDGNIIVDGTLVSAYTSATDSWNAGHSLLAPLRAVYRLAGVHASGLFGGTREVVEGAMW